MRSVSRNHIAELDGLRGLAVVMVLAWHFLGAMMDRSSAVSEIIYASTIFGRTGVDLFFVLSGFLIIGILVDERDNRKLFKTFYARRILRIHPPYAMLVLLYWVCYAAAGPNAAFNTSPTLAVQIFAQLTFTWNWLMAVYSDGIARGFSVTWSVAIEEWFYLIIPAVIVATPHKRLSALLVFIALGSLTARIAFYIIKPDLSMAPYVLTPLRLDGLAAGGFLALVYRDDRLWQRIIAKREQVWKATLIMAGSVPLLIGLLRNALAINMYTWGHAYLAITGCLIITSVLLFEGSDRLAVLRTTFLRVAGRISYTLYLVHPLFLSLFFVVSARPEFIRSGVDAIIAGSALIIAVSASHLSYFLIEKPLQSVGRHRFTYDVDSPSSGAIPRQVSNSRDTMDPIGRA